MLMSWADACNSSTDSGLNSRPFTPDCNFPCDGAMSECCDFEWVPQLKVSNVDTFSRVESDLAQLGPHLTTGEQCGCSRLTWSLTIDASYNADLDFRYFPFDSQLLNVTFFNPHFHHVHFQHLAGMLEIDGSFQDITQGMSRTL